MGKSALGLLLLILLMGLLPARSDAQGRVRAVVTSDVANIRNLPDFGGDPLGQVPAGYLIDPVNARNAVGDWLRFDFNGSEGWVHISTVSILQGDITALPVADPRSIPYGGFDAPRAGSTSNTGGPVATVRDWLRVRSGPSTAYVIIANVPINSQVNMLGRTAASNWIQVNYQGTLGWVATEWLIFPQEFVISQLPIDGIVAEAPPAGDAPEDFIGVLRLMRDRLDLAQPSLDTIRAYWTDSALTGRAACQPYPAQPSDFNIPNPLLAAYYNTLDPLRQQFNDAMFNLRYAIELFIQVCEQPGTQNPVGQATVIGALDVVSLADRLFADLRRQLNDLIPPPAALGEGECLLSFAGAVDVLPVLPIGQLDVQEFTPRDYAVGYCFDATEGQVLNFETLQTPESNGLLLLTVSPLDNPSNFLAVGRSTTPDAPLRVGPVTIPATGRYLLVVTNFEFPPEGVLSSRFAVLILQATDTGSGLIYDPVTGQFSVTVAVPVLTPVPTFGAPGSGICPNPSFSCAQLATCEDAVNCFPLNPSLLLNPGDTLPCQNVLCFP
ncbi:MAG: SH3 domain-containing protein [Chloroflexota bacterium]